MNIKELMPRVLIIMFIGLVIAIAGCVGQSGNDQSTPTTTVENTNNTANITANTTNTNATENNVTGPITTVNAAPPATIKCELCHTNPQNLTPHVNGGKLCINCHGSQVHNIHIGEGTVNLDCKTCHGFPPTIPKVQKGTGPGSYSVCEQCHAPPPDSLKPSNGNLIVIHLSRGKYCTNCHGTDIGAIHAAALAKLNATAPQSGPSTTNESGFNTSTS